MGSCLSSSKSKDESRDGNGSGGGPNVRSNYQNQQEQQQQQVNGNGNGNVDGRLKVETFNNENGKSQITGPFPASNSRSYSAVSTVNSSKGNNSNNNNEKIINNTSILSPASTGAPMNNQLDNTNNSNDNPIKILLLGSGESGKSTILKQMKIIHQNGYSQEERLMYKTTVYKNLVDCGKAVVDALDKFGISIDSEYEDGNDNNEDGQIKKKLNPLSHDDLAYIASSIISPDPDTIFDQHLSIILQNLWARPEVRKLVSQRRAEFYIMDSAPYFFSNVQRISDPDYIPDVNDILRARIKTTGIYETRFDMGGLNILMYDVGGQRSERKKWIHCFENVTLVIFCVALSEYDQVLLEQKGQNRMAESLVLFDSIINSPWFSRTSVVLFLNKIDVFTEKLPYSPLENYFPDYTGGNDVNKAVKYILWRFTQANKSGLNIYPHLTQATDTSNIRLVFAAVKETILQNALKDSGIL